MTENEAKDKEKDKDNNEEELMTKIRDELLSLSQKFISMSNYLEKLKIEIEKDDISDINDDNKNENMNLLGKKRIGTGQIGTIPDYNNSKNNNNQKEKQIETISNSSISDSNSSIKISENRNRNKSKSKISQNKAKNKIYENKTKHNSHNKKRKKLNINEDYGNNEEEEEDEDEDEEEYINSDEESSSSSLDEKKTHKNHIKHRKKKIKQTQNGIISKIYPVKIIQNDVISAGYRVYCKCKGISMCFGPYADFNFAFDFRKLMHSQLKMFTKDIPDVLEKIEEFLKRTKEAVDKKQAPVQMLKKCKTINN